MKKKSIISASLLFVFVGILFATTWFEIETECPICKKENTFQQIGSYGSYIYRWPSKFQYIYWPVTETYSVYTCQHCNYSALMWDFNAVSGDTLVKIKRALDGVPIEIAAKKDYTEIPVSKKLELAEIAYKSYQKDSDFWCSFYRIQGYHYEQEQLDEKAKQSRIKALNIAASLLADNKNAFRKKELLLITGAMKYFTNPDSTIALKDFKLAKSFKYWDSQSDSANNTGMNAYLDELLDEYILKINSVQEVN